MPLPIDLESETIQFDGQWCTRDELARRIKKMLDSGDFAVGKPSQALEQLTATLANLRTLSLRVTPEMGDALSQAAARQGKTVGGVIREAIAGHLGLKAADPEPTPSAGTRRVTDPEIPTAKAAAQAPAPAIPAPQAVIPGPGALKTAAPSPAGTADKGAIVTEPASPEEAASAVDLTPKKKEEEAVERRWFGG